MPVYYSSVDGESISFTVQNRGVKALSSSFTVQNIGSADLSSSLSIGSSKALSSSFTVRNAGSKGLSSSATIRNAASNDLSSSFTVRNIGSKALNSNVTVRNIGSKALSSSVTVQNIGSKALSSSATIRNLGSKALSSSFRVRHPATADLRTNVTVRNRSTNDLASNFWVNRASYKVGRISNRTSQKEYGALTIATTDVYQTVLQDDVEGYASVTVIVAAGTPNDIQYRIQGLTRFLPNVWATCRNQAGTALNDMDLTASDPEAAGIAETIKGDYLRIRIQAKNKNAGQNSRAWATIRATMET